MNIQNSENNQKQFKCPTHKQENVIAINISKTQQHVFQCQVCLINELNIKYAQSDNKVMLIKDIMNSKNSKDIPCYPFTDFGKDLKENLNKLESIVKENDKKQELKSQYFKVLDQFQKDVNFMVQNFTETVKTYLKEYQIEDCYNTAEETYLKTYNLELIKSSLMFPPSLPQTLQLIKNQEKQNQSQIKQLNKDINQYLDFQTLNEQLDKIQQIFYNNVKPVQIQYEKQEQVKLEKSKVGLPDAYNTVLYTTDLKPTRLYKLSFEKQHNSKSCHFFIGIIRDGLKDEVGYNHDMPSMCLFCDHQLNEVIIEQTLNKLEKEQEKDSQQQESVTQFKIKHQNEVIYQAEIQNKNQEDALFRFFLNFSYDLKFRLVEIK